MASLTWIGKEAVVNHHRAVPYRLLQGDAKLSVGPDGGVGSGNLLVQGDNLEALKALLPYYGGKVKCIYIDPPYNTGNEGWVYNDNVNSPEMKAWLGKAVGDEDADLSRHDKWLCMMFPRLSLLRDFLRDDGVILVSIDDFEAHRCRSLMDEVFGPKNFIAQLVWDKTRKNDAKLFSIGHEYMLVYASSLSRLKELKTKWREQKPGAKEIVAEWRRLQSLHNEDYAAIQDALREWYKALPKSHPSKKLSRYKWVDKDGPWRDRDISWPGGGGPRYDVPHPVTGRPCEVPEAGWRFSEWKEMERQIKVGLVQFREDHTKPPFRKAHLLPTEAEEELEAEAESTEEADAADDSEDSAGRLVMPSVIYKQAQVAVKLQRRIFDGKKVFPNPKDHEVIARLIRYVTEPDDLILDSFGGSGTTAHAVLQLNAEDSSSRRFVLVEMLPDIAKDITAKRIRKVVEGYHPDGDEKKEMVKGLGGGCRFVTLGPTLFDEFGHIRPDVRFADLAAHVFFTETGEPIPRTANGKKSPFIGACKGTAYYLLFNGILGDKRPDGGNVLTGDVLAELPTHNGPRVVFGEACRLGAARLAREGVTFKQIPYDVKGRPSA